MATHTATDTPRSTAPAPTKTHPAKSPTTPAKASPLLILAALTVGFLILAIAWSNLERLPALIADHGALLVYFFFFLIMSVAG